MNILLTPPLWLLFDVGDLIYFNGLRRIPDSELILQIKNQMLYPSYVDIKTSLIKFYFVFSLAPPVDKAAHRISLLILSDTESN